MARRDGKARRSPKARPQGILELTPRGFGFVKTSEGEFFIPASKTAGAFPGDLVEIVRLRDRENEAPDHRPRARVGKILARGSNRIIGRYEIADPFGVVIPEDPSIKHDIFTLQRESPDVKDGDIVEVEMLEYPTRNSAATGKIVSVLGSSDDSSLLVDLAVARNGLETAFTEATLEQAEACTLDVERALLDGYRDLRGERIFTVDPADARDFDDAISLERVDEGYKLGVHIADVSAYVDFGTAMDMDARKRTTSVYLVDRVLPMLPEKLSNDLCSLAPDENRLAMSVEMILSPSGEVMRSEVHPSVIRSKARFSYDQVQAILTADEGGEYEAMRSCAHPQGARALSREDVAVIADDLRAARKLSRALFERRYASGCMDFNRVEAKVQLDENGKPTGVNFRKRTAATMLIEEFMILANERVAIWLTEAQAPCVYRVHGTPDGDALEALYQILQEFPYLADIDGRLFCAGNPHEIQRVTKLSRGRIEEELVNALLLRSMKQAHYSPEPEPHYGVALELYCHFTSPIRRYPDLMVHRMIKDVLFGHSAVYQAMRHSLGDIAERCSEMERVAEKAARQSQEIKLIELLEEHVGETFTAVISGVSTFGLALRLENTATGVLDASDLGEEYFSFDPTRYTLTGSDTGTVYRLGAALEVVLVQASPRERILRFKRA